MAKARVSPWDLTALLNAADPKAGTARAPPVADPPDGVAAPRPGGRRRPGHADAGAAPEAPARRARPPPRAPGARGRGAAALLERGRQRRAARRFRLRAAHGPVGRARPAPARARAAADTGDHRPRRACSRCCSRTPTTPPGCSPSTPPRCSRGWRPTSPPSAATRPGAGRSSTRSCSSPARSAPPGSRRRCASA